MESTFPSQNRYLKPTTTLVKETSRSAVIATDQYGQFTVNSEWEHGEGKKNARKERRKENEEREKERNEEMEKERRTRKGRGKGNHEKGNEGSVGN